MVNAAVPFQQPADAATGTELVAALFQFTQNNHGGDRGRRQAPAITSAWSLALTTRPASVKPSI
jgi:hypothetical protein